MSKNLAKDLLFATICALSFSAFIYLEHYAFDSKILYAILALASTAMLLYMPKRAVLMSGFGIGLLWFYWIGYSFKYNGVGHLEPFVALGFGLVYTLFFAPLYFTNKPHFRAVMLFLLSFFAPMEFNWLVLELGFASSYFGAQKWHYAIILASLSTPYLLKKWRFLPLLALLFALDLSPKEITPAPLKIELVPMSVPQEQKWQRENLRSTLSFIYDKIEQSISNDYDLVVFPESAIPLFLNENPEILTALKGYSHAIAIVIGSLLREDGKHYNVSYKFENGSFEVAKKVVLVPFGEYIPLPSFLKKWVNEYFFAGASDFMPASKPSEFNIKGVEFRPAICYEATTDVIYHDHPRFVLAMSNNAWFSPSIEPTLQRLLMQFYAKKYGAIIYHSANYKGTGVIE